MGQQSGKTSSHSASKRGRDNTAVSNGRLTAEDVARLRATFGVKNGEKVDLSSKELMSCFPVVLRPLISRVVRELLPKQNCSKDKFSFCTLIELASVCIYPRRDELEERCLLAFTTSTPSRVDKGMIENFLKLAYIQGLVLNHPSAPLLSSQTASDELDDLTFQNVTTALEVKVPDSSLRSTLSWFNENMPSIAQTLAGAFRYQLLGGSPKANFFATDGADAARAANSSANFRHSPSMLALQQSTAGWRGFLTASASKVLNDETAFMLMQASPKLSNSPWTRLYASWASGTSFNRFFSSVAGYAGPSVLILKTYTGATFGACVFHSWDETNGKFVGSPDTFLFSSEPRFSIMRATSAGGNFVYLNSKNSFAARGLGFGGKEGAFRLWMDLDFKECYVCNADRTFSAGDLCLDKDNSRGSQEYQVNFTIQDIEVWGAGGSEALKAQTQAQNRDEQIRQERRQVDKSRFVESAFDQEFLLGDKFKAAKEARERANV